MSTQTDKNQKHKKLWDLLSKERLLDVETLSRSFSHHLEYTVGKFKHNTTGADVYQALAYTVRDALIDRFNESQSQLKENKSKKVYYLSMEFLLGRLLETNLINLGIHENASQALEEMGYNLRDVVEYEPDAGLGNGGLGRLAACFMDSTTSMNLPCTGAGLRYEFGIFHQHIMDGYQKEAPDVWLSHGNPWELMRPDIIYPIHFYGYTEQYITPTGTSAVKWYPGETVMAMAYDILVPGYDTKLVNNLRLWSCKSSSEFNFDYFNHGDYMRAVEDKERSESISKVLYPNENVIQGRELRLKQEYMLVSATLQDAIRSFRGDDKDWNHLPDRCFFQMNDTHPALCVAELMRLLVDIHELDWNYAWDITRKCLGYTNHTVMPEALEKWDVDMFRRLLPRHLEIIYTINFYFMEELKKRGDLSDVAMQGLSIIEEWPVKKVRMANLSVVGAKKVNGVAALHSELVKRNLFPDFYKIWPEKFQNKTNGITHRRWIVASNPDLTSLINNKIGKGWISRLENIKDIEQYADDPEFQNDWAKIKLKNKQKLAHIIQFESGVTVNPESIFDVQVKRIHEYKRQHLNILRVIGDYQRLKANPGMDYTPRTVIFGGKAAPGYYRAKLIIKLVHCVAEKVNSDPDVAGRLKVVFLPNYSVSLAERIFPASDLSEQISTAGTEASGTGNMKFMINGALTIGTLDGANIEMLEEAGKENFYIFGNTVEELNEIKARGYDPVEIYNKDADIRRILDALKGNFFNEKFPGLFQEIFHALTYGGDYYFLLADYHRYVDAQDIVAKDYKDRKSWLRKSILNTARCSKFTSDRTIDEYAKEIWELPPVVIK